MLDIRPSTFAPGALLAGQELEALLRAVWALRGGHPTSDDDGPVATPGRILRCQPPTGRKGQRR